MNVLYKAYLKSIKGSKWKETTQKFSLYYLRELLKLQEELMFQTYEPGEESHFILHERGKIRPITTLIPRDRIVRHVLCDELLMPEIKRRIIYDNASSIKGRGIDFMRKRFETHLHRAYNEYHTNQIYGLFIDFTKFYDNIDHKKATDILLELFDYDEYLSWLLCVIFENFRVDVSFMNDEEFEWAKTHPFNSLEYRSIEKGSARNEKFLEKSANIGDQFSQALGVYYPNEIDSYVKTVKGMKYYGRYCDDIYLFSNSKEELLSILNDISEIADKIGIFINHKKTKIVKLSSTYTFLQVRYSLTDTGKVLKRINPKRVISMRNKLKDLKRILNNHQIEYETVENTFKSWMGSHYKLLSKKQRIDLINRYEDLFDRKIVFENRSGKRRMIIKEDVT